MMQTVKPDSATLTVGGQSIDIVPPKPRERYTKRQRKQITALWRLPRHRLMRECLAEKACGARFKGVSEKRMRKMSSRVLVLHMARAKVFDV